MRSGISLKDNRNLAHTVAHNTVGTFPLLHPVAVVKSSAPVYTARIEATMAAAAAGDDGGDDGRGCTASHASS